MNRPTRTKLSERGPGLGRLAAIAGAVLSLPLRPPTRRTAPFLAQGCGIDAPKAHYAHNMRAARIIRGIDASENRVQVCSDLSSIFRVRALSLSSSVWATQVLVRSKEAASVTGQLSARGLKNYAHK